MTWAQLCRRCSYRLWQILVMLLVLLALGVSSLRLLAPYADHIKQPVQDWFTHNFQLQLDYQALDIEWHHFGLYLTLKQVDIDPLEGEDQVKQLKSLSVRFEPWRSALAGQVLFGEIRLEGLELEIATQANLNGNSPSQMSWQQVLQELASKRFEQFQLEDARLTLVNSPTSKQHIIIPTLHWRNEVLKHQGEGWAHIEGYPEQSARFIVDIDGYSAAPEAIKGRLYLNVENLSAHPFFKFWMHDAVEMEQSELNFQAWLDFDLRELKQAWVALGDNNLRWRHQGSEPRLFQVSEGHLIFKSLEQGWRIMSDGLRATTNQFEWPEPRVAMIKSGSKINAELEGLDLAGLTPLLEFYPGLSAQLAEWANQSSGAVQKLRWQSEAGQPWLLRGDLVQASWPQTSAIPGVEALDLSFELAPSALIVQADAGPQTIEPAGQFAEPLELVQLTSQIQAQWGQTGWKVSIPQLNLETAHLSTSLSAKLIPDEHQQTQLFLYGEGEVNDVAELWRYFPLKKMGSRLTAYLQNSIQGGQVSHLQGLWHGRLSDFPFTEQTGQFQLIAPVQETQMKFNSQWPALQAELLTLEFHNRDLIMGAPSAYLLEAQVTQLAAKIPGLGRSSVLTINGDVETQGEKLRAVINDSMLANTLGQTLELLDLKGEVQGPLQLDIPLAGGHVEAQGYADLSQGRLNIPGSTQHHLDEVQGRVYFQQQAIQIEGLTGSYRQLPVNLSLTGDKADGYYGIQARLEGEWPMEGIQQLPGISLPETQGQLVWQGGVEAQVTSQGAKAKIKVTSDLNQLAINLPAPLTKPLGESWHTQVNIDISEDATLNGRAVVGDQLFAMWHQGLKQENSNGDFVWLGLGTQQPLKGTPAGVTLDVRLPELDLTPWLNLPSSNSDKSKRLPFEQGNWQVGQMTLFDYQLPQVEMAIRPVLEGWQADIVANETLAELLYQVEPQPKIRLKARQLSVSKPKSDRASDGSETTQVQDAKKQLASVPELDIHCLQCRIDNFFFDELRLTSLTDVEAGYWRADEAWFKAGSGTVNFEQFGWQLMDQGSQSQLVGRIQALDFDELTRTLLPDSEFPIKDSSLEGLFQFVWPGAPYEFATHSLNGDVNWTLGEGHISELSDKGARVFSLLSMESIIRKIRLDFSDVFDKGLFYNEMVGSFEFRDGVVKSDPIEMDGVAGDMVIRGQTNLITKELDYDVVFNPDLTSSLPILAGLTINPVTGIYVLALHTVMKPVVEVVTQIRFEVSGTTDEPVVTEVGRSKKEIQVEPAPTEPEAEPLDLGIEPDPLEDSNEPESADQKEPSAEGALLMPEQVEQLESAQEAEPEPLLPDLPLVAPMTVGEAKQSDG